MTDTSAMVYASLMQDVNALVPVHQLKQIQCKNEFNVHLELWYCKILCHNNKYLFCEKMLNKMVLQNQCNQRYTWSHMKNILIQLIPCSLYIDRIHLVQGMLCIYFALSGVFNYFIYVGEKNKYNLLTNTVLNRIQFCMNQIPLEKALQTENNNILISTKQNCDLKTINDIANIVSIVTDKNVTGIKISSLK